MSDQTHDEATLRESRAAGRHTPRRGFLAETAAAVAAFGVGGAIFGGQDAAAAAVSEAAAIPASGLAGTSPVVELTPSGDQGGGTDVAAINNALSTAQAGDQVWLGVGNWYINAPIDMPPMRVLRGTRGAIAGFDSPNNAPNGTGGGTNIMPVAKFASPYPVSAAIVVRDTGSGNAGAQIRDLTIDGSLLDRSKAPVDGIASYGVVQAVGLTDLCIYAPTGNGINCASAGNANADGWKAYRVMMQHPGETGWYQVPGDTVAVDVHIQYAGTTGGAGNGFYVGPGGNVRFIGCRADLSLGSGWVIDHAGSGGGYTDATVLAGCGTERNQKHGALVTNSSGTGWRDPVVISGCSFGEDGWGGGSGGDYAGIWVEGNNRVFITGCTVFVGALTTDFPKGCPKYGLVTAATGGGTPALVVMTGGHLNFADPVPVKGAAPILNAAGGFFFISPDVTCSPGYQSGTIYPRLGTATLSGGTATVSSPWITPSSRIFISNVHGSAGPNNPGVVYVSSRTTGAFTITSNQATDQSDIAWQIVSQ